MTLDDAAWMLTGLAAVVVRLTRLRLSDEHRQPGHALVPRSVVNAHTAMGIVALAVWIDYLTAPDDLVGRCPSSRGGWRSPSDC